MSAGFFGKLPARGDFVSRGLDRLFCAAFDEWLQQCIATSRRQLGDDWLPAYLEMPVWRFVLGPGVCGAVSRAGVMMPSVDRVGRYFPFMIAAQMSGRGAPVARFESAQGWFDQAERLILRGLDDDFDFDRFDAAVMALSPPADVGIPEMDSGGARGSLWWTLGSERVRPFALMGKNLPAPGSFAALLDGRWDAWGWVPAGDGYAMLQEMPVLECGPASSTVGHNTKL